MGTKTDNNISDSSRESKLPSVSINTSRLCDNKLV